MVSEFQLYFPGCHKVINFDDFYKTLERTPELKNWASRFQIKIKEVCARNDGNLNRWLEIVENLPEIRPSLCDFSKASVTIGQQDDINETQSQHLRKQLKALCPWRKGPFSLFGNFIDTEWRSDWKWERVAPHLSPLEDRVVLDVGTGSGYHCWRMYGEGARLVIGIDPWWLYVMQFHALKHFAGPAPVFNLPLGIQDIPSNMQAFDTVFSMGVLYHRKAPIEHLQQLLQCLKKGGEMLLETLIIDGDKGQVLVPDDRYAKMKNVWFLPSIPELTHWLRRSGFVDIQVVDVEQTSLEEQRSTEWMSSESLKDFLDPNNLDLTIEGYQAPKRAVFIAKRP